MPHWEADIYARDLPPDQWNGRWWKYVSDFQGIEPPAPRGEEFCDAATKTHINDTPAYYYNYAFATVFKFQLHDYIARKILHQSPQSCNYADNKEVGAWLNNILKKGGTEDWRKVLKEATGEDISTRAMMEYFKPLMSWLEATKQRPPNRLGLASAERRTPATLCASTSSMRRKRCLANSASASERLTGSAGNRDLHRSRQYNIR
mgnify:CR=1 FL=1